jgi:hypothetical protein
MARRSFDVVDVTEILIHWHAGRSISAVSTSLGVDRKTIRKYLAPAVAAGLTPGGPAMAQADWAALVLGWFPHLHDTSLRQVTWPEIAVHHDYIVAQLKAGVTQATIHQRLRDEHGLRASLASVKRYVAANLAEEVRRDQVVVLRDPVAAGEEAQIDYGHLGWWVDPATGRRRKVWALVMVLCCSRHMFVRPNADDGPTRLDRGACGGVRVLRRCAAPTRAGTCSAEHIPGSVPSRLSLLCGCECPCLLDLTDFCVGGLSWARTHESSTTIV